MKRKRKSKYRNVRTKVDGITFDSKKEAARWTVLHALLMAEKISNLRRQIPYDFAVKGEHICTYIADFVYVLDGVVIVEDVKSKATRKLPVYRIKKKLMKAIYGLEILEV